MISRVNGATVKKSGTPPKAGAARTKRPQSEMESEEGDQDESDAGELAYDSSKVLRTDSPDEHAKYQSNEQSCSSLSVPEHASEIEKAAYLNDLFKDLKDSVSPKKASSPVKSPTKSSKVLKLTFKLLKYKEYVVAVTASGSGTYHVHRFFKGEDSLCGVTNDFGKGIFLTDASHTRNLQRGNYPSASLLNPGNGTWYVIAARDCQEVFVERSLALHELWKQLHPHLANLRSLEDPDNFQLDVNFLTEDIAKELFNELAFTHYNTLKRIV